MSLIRIFFIIMAVKYGRMFRRRDTRLWYAVMGPPLIVAGFVGVFVGWPAVLAVALISAGYAIMRRQSNMRDAELSQNTLRTGAVVTAVLVLALGAGTREYVAIAGGLAIAAALVALHHVPTPPALDQEHQT